MKLPERPIDVKKLLNEDLERFKKAIASKDFLETATKYNKRYLYFSELKYRMDDKIERGYLWALMKMLRRNNYEELSLGDLKMKYTLLPKFNKKLHLFDKNLAGHIKVDGKSLNLQESYIISSLMEEAIASSQIEGAATTRKIAKAMLREKRKPKNESEKMIVNNYNTLQFILRKQEENITPELILGIQEMVTKDTLEDSEDEGKFRDNNDIAVRSDEVVAHVPPDYKKIKSLMKIFCDFANESSKEFVHPILKGIILHFLIGYIHPFNDGNGRTARSIFYWYMLKQGYWLFEYMAVSKRILRSRKNYDLAYLYTEYDDMDLTYFLNYNLEAIEDSLKDMIIYIKKQEEEQIKTKEIIAKNPDLNLRQALIFEEFMKNPLKLFTLKEISETYGIVYETARTDLNMLRNKGLIERKISGRTFVYSYKNKY